MVLFRLTGNSGLGYALKPAGDYTSGIFQSNPECYVAFSAVAYVAICLEAVCQQAKMLFSDILVA